MKKQSITVIGVPTSAGAYGPGQEKAPDALRAAGLIDYLQKSDFIVSDKMNVPGFRWQVDRENPRSMNVDQVAQVIQNVSSEVSTALREDNRVLVLGGDCTIEIGCVLGALDKSENIGLIYIDLDTDLNTPESVTDGALDWMGVAHMLNIEGSEPVLSFLGSKVPMLGSDQICFFACGNFTDFEKACIERLSIRKVGLEEVQINPADSAKQVCENWASGFDQILIHLDVDVLDFVDMPIAENYRRNTGLQFDQLLSALKVFLSLPNWSVMTITEVNPDHGDAQGSTLKFFCEKLAEVMKY